VITSGPSLRFFRLPGRRSADPFENAGPRGFSVRVVRLEGEARRSPHRHPHSQEAIYVVRGQGTLWEDGIPRRFREGDCALIETGVAHATIPDLRSEMELVCMWPHPDLNRNIEELDEVIEVGGLGGGGAA
jgi:quercetin dioxygenase-like cupin family protein